MKNSKRDTKKIKRTDKLAACHSSKKTGGSDDHRTPDGLLKWLKEGGFKFSLDAAASKKNRVCKKYLSDALTVSWKTKNYVWCNPPYSLTEKFVEKAIKESSINKVYTVMLLPVRTGRQYWKLIKLTAMSVDFIIGRLYFKGSKQGAPFDSCLVYFGPPGREGGCDFEFIDLPLKYRR